MASKLTTINKKYALAFTQYLHAVLNQICYENKLRCCQIIYAKNLDNGVGGFTCFEDGNYLIQIDFDVLYKVLNNNEDFISVEVFKEIVITMLHEMAHQYCYENNIKDVDDNGKHNLKFKEIAEKNFLIINGKNDVNYIKPPLEKSLIDALICIANNYDKQLNNMGKDI